MNVDNDLINKLIRVCQQNRINIYHLPDIIANKKVAPMIRGIGSEYELLSLFKEGSICARKNEEKDIDLYVRIGDKEYKSEVKQAKKDSLRINTQGVLLQIKCMRSRTSGEKRSAQRAAILNIDPALYKMHSDQYREFLCWYEIRMCRE